MKQAAIVLMTATLKVYEDFFEKAYNDVMKDAGKIFLPDLLSEVSLVKNRASDKLLVYEILINGERNFDSKIAVSVSNDFFWDFIKIDIKTNQYAKLSMFYYIAHKLKEKLVEFNNG